MKSAITAASAPRTTLNFSCLCILLAAFTICSDMHRRQRPHDKRTVPANHPPGDAYWPRTDDDKVRQSQPMKFDPCSAEFVDDGLATRTLRDAR